jgi:hypothetical protein
MFSIPALIARRQDILALVVQSIGGGIASTTQPVLGGHIALGGIALQLGTVSSPYHIFASISSND